MSRYLQDIRYAIRTQMRQPKLPLIMIFTLALGIGSVTCVFTIVQSVLLRPLRYEHPDRLVRAFESNPSKDSMYFSVSAPNWTDWRTRSRTIQDLAAFTRPEDINMDLSGEPVEVTGARISSNLLPVLGVQPLYGRNFTAAADASGQERSVLLNYDLWKVQFAGDPGVVGQTLTLNRGSYVVAGILPPGFHLPFGDAQIYLPLSLSEKELQRSHRFLRVVGRLKSEVSLEQSAAEMRAIAASLESEYRDSNLGWSVTMKSLNEVVIPPDFRLAVWVLFGSVALVLLIACVNVANLLTAGVTERRREISIRRALGASGARLFVQFLAESCLIALAAAVAGAFLASWFVTLLQSLQPDIPRLHEIHMNWVVLLFAVSVSLLTVLLFGTASALQGLKHNVQQDLKEGGRAGTPGRRRERTRKALVIVEASMAVLLLIGAGLLIRSFLRLNVVNPGFDPGHVVTVKVTMPEGGSHTDFQRRILDRIEALPGVRKAAFASVIPLRPGNPMNAFTLEGKEGETFAAAYRVVSAGYFEAMGIPLIRGRSLDEARRGDSGGSIVIDESAWRRFWPGEDPMEKKVYLSGLPDAFWIRGIAGGVRSFSLDEDPLPTLYLSSSEVPPGPTAYVVVRSAGDPANVAAVLRSSIREAMPGAIVGTPALLSDVVNQSLSERRFHTLLLGIFAAIAFILAMVGLYSVIAYSVAQRTHEIGIRMAVGARRADVVAMIVRQGLTLAASGAAIGLVASLAMTRALASLLYKVDPADAMTFQLVALFFLVIALAASYFPARRAASLDPVIALKHE